MAMGAAHFGKKCELESNWKAWDVAELEVGHLDSPAATETDEHASVEEVAMCGEES